MSRLRDGVLLAHLADCSLSAKECQICFLFKEGYPQAARQALDQAIEEHETTMLEPPVAPWARISGDLGPDEDPPEGGPTLRQQARYAETSLDAFAITTENPKEDNKKLLRKLLTAIYHFCDQEGYDADEIHKEARRAYCLDTDGIAHQ